MSKPYFAPFRVSDFAARELLYVREALAHKAQAKAKYEHQHKLKLARDARYRANKKARRLGLADPLGLVNKALYLRTPLATQAGAGE